MKSTGRVVLTIFILLCGLCGCARYQDEDTITCLADDSSQVASSGPVLASADCFKKYDTKPLP